MLVFSITECIILIYQVWFRGRCGVTDNYGNEDVIESIKKKVTIHNNIQIFLSSHKAGEWFILAFGIPNLVYSDIVKLDSKFFCTF